VEDVLAAVQADSNQQKGEFVLVIGGTAAADPAETPGAQIADLDKTLLVLLPHLPIKTVARCGAELCGVTRKQAYDRALQLQRR
jgi:16S rRNA (cytidine1402-2'-O)-methyltransferase